jgi:hypothetical protein
VYGRLSTCVGWALGAKRCMSHADDPLVAHVQYLYTGGGPSTACLLWAICEVTPASTPAHDEQEVVINPGGGAGAGPKSAPVALYTYDLKRKSHFLSSLLHPNTAPVRSRMPACCS